MLRDESLDAVVLATRHQLDGQMVGIAFLQPLAAIGWAALPGP